MMKSPFIADYDFRTEKDTCPLRVLDRAGCRGPKEVCRADACLGRVKLPSKPSIPFSGFSVFPITWVRKLVTISVSALAPVSPQDLLHRKRQVVINAAYGTRAFEKSLLGGIRIRAVKGIARCGPGARRRLIYCLNEEEESRSSRCKTYDVSVGTPPLYLTLRTT
jgi:hypothetical protein